MTNVNELKVTVVIPTYNRPHYVCEAIDSVLNQTYSNIEIIVVDDGSTTDIGQVVAHYGSKIRFHRKQNGGLASARNAGLSLASGNLIAFLDDDDRWLPDKLEKQMEPFYQDTTLDAVYGTITVFNDQTGERFNHTCLGRRVDIHTILKQHFPPLQTLVVKTETLRELNGFDLNVPGVEDWDLYLRLFVRYSLLGIPDILAEVRSHDSNMSADVEKSSLVSLKVLEKNRGIHGNCPECRIVTGETEKWLRKKVFYARRYKAQLSAKEGRRMEMLKWYLSALQAYTFRQQIHWVFSKLKRS